MGILLEILVFHKVLAVDGVFVFFFFEVKLNRLYLFTMFEGDASVVHFELHLH